MYKLQLLSINLYIYSVYIVICLWIECYIKYITTPDQFLKRREELGFLLSLGGDKDALLQYYYWCTYITCLDCI